MFGRYSVIEVLTYFILTILVIVLTAAFFTHASWCTETFFSTGLGSRKKIRNYCITSIITAVLLVVCFMSVYDFLNIFNMYWLKGFYNGSSQTLLKVFFLHSSNTTIAACLILVVLLTVLFLTLLFKATPLYALIPTNYREKFNL
jgi:hypothetical protein